MSAKDDKSDELASAMRKASIQRAIVARNVALWQSDQRKRDERKRERMARSKFNVVLRWP